MKTRLLLAAALIAAAPAAMADDTLLGDLLISDPFARASAGQARAGAAYMTVTNQGRTDDTLIAAQAPLAARVELHEIVMDGDVMRMRETEGGIPVPAGQTVTLQPGGYHVMLMGLTGPLVEGESVPVTLEFEDAGSVTVDVPIAGIGATAPGE